MSDERLLAPLSLFLTGSFSELLPPFSLISGILPILTKDEIPLELCEFLRVALATCDGAVARTLRAPWGRPREGPPRRASSRKGVLPLPTLSASFWRTGRGPQRVKLEGRCWTWDLGPGDHDVRFHVPGPRTALGGGAPRAGDVLPPPCAPPTHAVAPVPGGGAAAAPAPARRDPRVSCRDGGATDGGGNPEAEHLTRPQGGGQRVGEA